ncbi:hypothetical protein L1887_28686 [Cichorium endivia]|nr:hypothetical protein L1887_28686 [Cichorium endivia]
MVVPPGGWCLTEIGRGISATVATLATCLSPSELFQIFKLAAPVFIMMISKVAFYSLLAYFATSMGTQTVAVHQARMLLKSLVIIGSSCGLILGAAGTIVPWLCPQIFSPAPQAGHDLRFISFSMSTMFSLGALLLMAMVCLAAGGP